MEHLVAIRAALAGPVAGGGADDAVTLPSTHPSAPLRAGPQLIDQRIDQRIDHVLSGRGGRISG
ncbi:hypothetical protein [Actinoplanes missouriensis]|uniref:hypothetical protein n=1 Tax=Actinoplanes missouriensis TaxID=1866 RepID=UPI0005A031A0|nr:hypothetical protein [Actinoplanes missouriensis]